MTEIVRCKDCGLLAVRNAEDSLIYPASEHVRATAEVPMREFPGAFYPGHGANVQMRDPIICYVGEGDFAQDSQHSEPFTVIDNGRCCESFLPWTPGRSPEQHLNMRELQEQRDHNAKMLAEERKFREQQAAAERDWRDAERKARDKEAELVADRHQKDSDNAERRFKWGLGVVIAAAVIGQLLAGFIHYRFLTPAISPASTIANPPSEAPAPHN